MSYAIVYAVLAALLSLLPGGRSGNAAGLVLGGGATIGGAVMSARFFGLRQSERGPFVGSRRASALFMGLFFLPLGIALLLMETVGAKNDTIFWGAVIFVATIWVVMLPVMVVSERRRMVAAGQTVWPPPRSTAD